MVGIPLATDEATKQRQITNDIVGNSFFSIFMLVYFLVNTINRMTSTWLSTDKIQWNDTAMSQFGSSAAAVNATTPVAAPTPTSLTSFAPVNQAVAGGVASIMTMATADTAIATPPSMQSTSEPPVVVKKQKKMRRFVREDTHRPTDSAKFDKMLWAVAGLILALVIAFILYRKFG